MNIKLVRALAGMAAVLVLEQTLFAGDLKAPFELESAKVLPKGIGNPRYKNLWMFVDSKFDDSFKSQPLGYKLNKRVSWADVLEGQSNEIDRNLVRGVLADANNGISDPSDNGSPGATTGTVTSYANVKIPVIAYGFSDRFTLAVAIPVMHIEANAVTGFVKSEDGQKFVDGVFANNPQKGAEAKAKLNDAVNQKLKRLGYDPIQNQKVDAIGDVKIVGKIGVINSESDQLAFKIEGTAPTGIRPNADPAIDLMTGDGQWDVGGSLILDHYWLPSLRSNFYGGYVAQLPDQLQRRLPTSITDSLSADKELVSRNLGDFSSLGTSLSYEWIDYGFNIGAGYSFQFLSATKYKNGLFAPERYRLLENEMPLQAVHSVTASMGFSTLEFFKQKKFFYPMQIGASYSHPFKGRNVTTNDVIAGEIVLFF